MVNLIKERISNQFFQRLGYQLNLDNPKSFNEKIQWLKLYYHDPLITQCADKYAVRKYVAKKIGKQYLIPLIGIYEKAEDIDFTKLPNKFVLKINNASGRNIICKNKNKLNFQEVRNKLTEWLKPETAHYLYAYEWAYKDIKPKIVCEKYIEQKNHDLYDYKFYCFHGEPKFIRTFRNRAIKIEKNSYDINWNRLDVSIGTLNSTKHTPKPKNLKEMISISKKLSQNFPMVRVDLYQTKKQIYFGELTFYPTAGLDKISPLSWDYKIGNYINIERFLSKKNNVSNLKNDLISLEIKYGGLITNIPRNKVSPLDPRPKDEIKTGGMTGGDRMLNHGYAQKYAENLLLFSKRKKITIMEIGILKGTGLAIWCDLFKNSKIIGLDIDISHFKRNFKHLKKIGAFTKNTPQIFEFDQLKNNQKYLQKILGKRKIDVCIDDGLHSNKSNLNTFKNIKPYLSNDFVYFIEDNKQSYKKIKKKYPNLEINNFGELTVIHKKNYIINDYLKNKKNRQTKIVIYTAITNNYDNLIQPKYISNNFDYICFSDQKIKKPGIWEIKKIKNSNLDPNRKSKEYKILPHKFLKKYEYSVWVDSNIDMTTNFLEETINRIIKNPKILISVNPHFERNCIYQEADICIQEKKDDPEKIIKEINFLKKEKYPKNNGLFENNIIFRQHKNPIIINSMNNWWKMIKKFSYRDQLSFNYILYQNKLKCKLLFNQSARFIQDFNFIPHNSKIVSELKINNNQDNFYKTLNIVGSTNSFKTVFDLSQIKIKNNQAQFDLEVTKFSLTKISSIFIKTNKSIKKINTSPEKLITNAKTINNKYFEFKTLKPIIIFKIPYQTQKIIIKGKIIFIPTPTIDQLTTELEKIQSAKTYKAWQKYNKIKNFFIKK